MLQMSGWVGVIKYTSEWKNKRTRDRGIDKPCKALNAKTAESVETRLTACHNRRNIAELMNRTKIHTSRKYNYFSFDSYIFSFFQAIFLLIANF